MDFWQFHKLYDAIYEELEGSVDMIAERVGALGGVAHGTARMAAASSSLPEFTDGFGDGKKFTTELRDRVAAYANMLHDNITKSDSLGDPTTADLLTEISRTANKNLYFLESHLH
jgi:starvation-inducible DNA-binding protein